MVALLALWLARAFIVAEFARNYFRSHGVDASVEIGALGLSGVSGRFGRAFSFLCKACSASEGSSAAVGSSGLCAAGFATGCVS